MAPPKKLGKCLECDEPASGLGYCARHYQLYRRWGCAKRPSEIFLLKRRLWRHIQPEPNSGCWLWIGSTYHHGHGRMIYRGKPCGAHRVSWIAHVGQIPADKIVCHRCGISSCVNPGHLYLGTPASNSQDMIAHGRSPRGERSGAAKLTTAIVLDIRRDQRRSSEIARELGVSDVLIGKIKRREIWKHI